MSYGGTVKLATLIILTCMSQNAQSAQPGELTLEEARSIVGASLSEATRRLPGLSLEDFSDAKTPNFYFIEVVWNNPNGSVVWGNYYVDKSTGDLWSAVMECDRITSSRIRALQHDVRRKIGLTDEEYRKIKRPEPLCEPTRNGPPQAAAVPHN
jgi:hypothetical protein